MSAKRWREPKAKDGELKAQWGKLQHDTPDLCYAWGDGCSRRDGHLLHNVLTGERFSPGLPVKSEKGLVAELEERGYDITTLKFSIQKKSLPKGVD